MVTTDISNSHNKADCPNPKVERPFTGQCRICNEEGHPAAQCPSKPPTTCRNCGQEGHIMSECTSARTGMFSDRPDKPLEEAWSNFTEVLQGGDSFEYASVCGWPLYLVIGNS